MRLGKHVCLWSLGLMLGLTGCGNQPTTTSQEVDYPSLTESTIATNDATVSSTPESIEVGESTNTVVPHAFTKYIGSGILRAPKSLTASGDYVIVCDQNHYDPIGYNHDPNQPFGLAIQFGNDGQRQGYGFTWLDNYQTLSTMRLQKVNAVSTDGNVVYVADATGIYGYEATSQRVFNNGSPYVTTAFKDIVQTSDTLYALSDSAIVSFALPSFRVKKYIPVTGNGLGITNDGKPVLAMDNAVVVIDGDNQTTYQGFTNLKDVAVDPKSGDIYALSKQEVLRLDAEGKIACRFGYFAGASSIGIDSNSYVYVSDPLNSTVSQFSPRQ